MTAPVRVCNVPLEAAVNKWAVTGWANWQATSNSFFWNFADEITIYIISGHAIIRPAGPWEVTGPVVVSSGSLLLLAKAVHGTVGRSQP